jgi:hypothetical protein
LVHDDHHVKAKETQQQTAIIIKRALEAAKTITQDQKTVIECLLRKYDKYFTSTPGLCNSFEYEFFLRDHQPITMRERAIPFALREEVRKQIEMMLRNEIIETSTSSYVNPLTIVLREGKSPRICVDARRLNAVTIPDPEKCQPLTEMLQ